MMMMMMMLSMTGDSCPTPELIGWYLYNGYCYYHSVTDAEQSKARAQCQAMKGDLVSFSDQAEADYVESNT